VLHDRPGRELRAELDLWGVTKRLLVRYDRRAEIHEAFLALGCCLVCFRRLQRSF
jgi:hypothetical protein